MTRQTAPATPPPECPTCGYPAELTIAAAYHWDDVGGCCATCDALARATMAERDKH